MLHRQGLIPEARIHSFFTGGQLMPLRRKECLGDLQLGDLSTLHLRYGVLGGAPSATADTPGT